MGQRASLGRVYGSNCRTGEKPLSAVLAISRKSAPEAPQRPTRPNSQPPSSRRAEVIRSFPPCPRTSASSVRWLYPVSLAASAWLVPARSEEHTSELQSLRHLVC